MKVYLVVRHTNPGDQHTLDVYTKQAKAKARAKRENRKDGRGYKNVAVETWETADDED